MSGVTKIPAQFVPPGKPRLLLDGVLPKAVLMDIIWNWSQIVAGSEDEQARLGNIIGEALVCRPHGRWGAKLMALERRIARNREQAQRNLEALKARQPGGA